MKSIIFSVLLAVSLNGPVQAQNNNGPGGVSNTSGAGILKIWLRPDEGVVYDENQKVTEWNDQSGYENHAISVGSGFNPTYIPSAQNGIPAVRFNFSKLEIPSSATFETANVDVFAVVKRNAMTSFGTVFSRKFYEAGPWQEPYVSISMMSSERFNTGMPANPNPYAQVAIGISSPPYFQRLCNWNPPNSPVETGTAYIHQLIYDGTQMESWINNHTEASIIPGAGSINYNNNNLPLVLGAGGASSGDEFLGDISEIVYFGSNVSIVDQVIVLNYLAAKYGISVTYDKYDEKPGFIYDVIGIGRESGSVHLVSEGAELKISASSYPLFPAYLFAGHNNAPFRGTVENIPAEHQSRMQRVWYIDVSGGAPPTTSFTFTLPFSPSATSAHYSLLFSSSSDFSNPEVVMQASQVSVAQKTVQFNIPATSMTDGYYTLGCKVNHWNGSSGNQWSIAENWEGGVPQQSSDVMITANCPAYPVMDQDGVCRNFYVQNNGQINQNGYDLNIYRDFVYGGSAYIHGDGTLHFSGTQSGNIWSAQVHLGNVKVEKQGAALFNIAENLNVRGDLELISGNLLALSTAWQVGGDLSFGAGLNYQMTGVSITLDGDGSQAVSGEFTGSTLIINNANPEAIIDMTSANPFMLNTLEVNSGHLLAGLHTLWNLIVNPDGVMELTDHLTITRDFINQGSMIPGNYSLIFSENQQQHFDPGNSNYYDILINKSGGSLNLSGNLSISHNLSITQGEFCPDIHTLNLRGSLINNGNFTPGSSEVIFDGGVAQEISGNGTEFYDLSIQNNSVVDIPANGTDDINIQHRLTIDPGSVMNILEDGRVKIDGTVANHNGINGIVVHGSEVMQGSFIHNETELEATVHQCLAAGRWQNLTIPVQGALAGVFMDMYLRSWSEAGVEWLWVEGPGSENTPLNSGTGYAVWPETPSTVTFSGMLNYSGNFSLPVTGHNLNPLGLQNWNFTGNPYLCGLDLSAGDLLAVDLSETIFVWDGDLGNYLFYNDYVNNGTVAGGIIPPVQGFWIKATGLLPELAIPQSMRVHANNTLYKSGRDDHPSCLHIAVDGPQGRGDRMIILLNELADPGFAEQEDALKLPGSSDAPSLYSMAGTEPLSMDTRPYSDGDETVVPLKFTCGTEGIHHFTFGGTDSFEGRDIYLTDHLTGNFYWLNEQPQISFTAALSDPENRFELRFKNASGSNDNFMDNGLSIIYSQGRLFMSSTPLEDLTVELFSPDGKRQISVKGGRECNSWPVNLPSGIYLCRILSGNIAFSQKILVK